MTRLRSINGYTRADLQNMGMTALFLRHTPIADSLSGLDCGSLSISQNPEPEALDPAPLTLTPGTLTPLRELGASVVKVPAVKVRKPRSKIARLPEPIQTNLNTMLASGRPYMDIIRYLNAQGCPGFNKVNLHDWKKTGFQQWLRNANRDMSLETVRNPAATGSKPE